MKTLLIVMMLGLAACATKRPSDYGRIVPDSEESEMQKKRKEWAHLNREDYFMKNLPYWYQSENEQFTIRMVYGTLSGSSQVYMNFEFKELPGAFINCRYDASVYRKPGTTTTLMVDLIKINFMDTSMKNYDKEKICVQAIGSHEIDAPRDDIAIVDGFEYVLRKGLGSK